MRAIERAVGLLDAAAAVSLCVLICGESAPHLIAAVLLHELSHVAALRCRGVKHIRLAASPTGLRIYYPGAALSFCSKLAVSLAGCASNLIAAAVSIPVGAFRFAAINTALAVFNLLPIAGLDGGEALSTVFERCADPSRAYAASRVISLVFAAALWIGAVFVSLRIFPSPEILLVSSILFSRELY